jgi:hypothetical protein
VGQKEKEQLEKAVRRKRKTWRSRKNSERNERAKNKGTAKQENIKIREQQNKRTEK